MCFDKFGLEKEPPNSLYFFVHIRTYYKLLTKWLVWRALADYLPAVIALTRVTVTIHRTTQKLFMCCFNILLVQFGSRAHFMSQSVNDRQTWYIIHCLWLNSVCASVHAPCHACCVDIWEWFTSIDSVLQNVKQAVIILIYITIAFLLFAGWGYHGRCLQTDYQAVDRLLQPVSSQKTQWWWYLFSLIHIPSYIEMEDFFIVAIIWANPLHHPQTVMYRYNETLNQRK